MNKMNKTNGESQIHKKHQCNIAIKNVVLCMLYL